MRRVQAMEGNHHGHSERVLDDHADVIERTEHEESLGAREQAGVQEDNEHHANRSHGGAGIGGPARNALAAE